MNDDRPVRLYTVIRPRRLPYVVAALLLMLPTVALIALRRDLQIEIGLIGWLCLAGITSAGAAFATLRLLRPRPLLRVTPVGIEVPRMLSHPLKWGDIQRIDADTDRIGGGTRDRLIIHLRTPMVLNWATRRLRRLFAGIPQAAVAVEVGLKWPERAEAVHTHIRQAARAFAETQNLSDQQTVSPDHRRWITAAVVGAAALLPLATHQAGIGLPRLLSTGLALYDAGETTAAVPHLTSDARAGDVEAAFALGTLYLNGDGVTRNPSMAAGWFQRAANAGHAKAAYHVGEAYRLGVGLPLDIDKALQWYRRAAGRGAPEAAYAVARMFRLGDGVRRDYGEAVLWLESAANDGFAPAQHDLGRLYHDGIALPRNLEKAVDWYTRAAKGGSLAARYDLARLLLDGTESDRKNGLVFLRQAAENGFAPAQRRLANMYRHGTDTARDLIEALKWISLAERSWPAATRADLVRERARIEALLSPTEKDEAKTRIRAWRPLGRQARRLDD